MPSFENIFMFQCVSRFLIHNLKYVIFYKENKILTNLNKSYYLNFLYFWCLRYIYFFYTFSKNIPIPYGFVFSGISVTFRNIRAFYISSTSSEDLKPSSPIPFICTLVSPSIQLFKFRKKIKMKQCLSRKFSKNF